jgi:hypothetical protein
VTKEVRFIMVLAAMTFFAAASIHAGFLVDGYQHREARIAETVIGAVLFAGAAAASINPRWTRAAGLFALGFALVGTLVGITTIAIGIGPRTFADITYHILIVLVLLYGLVVAYRQRSAQAHPHA